MKRSVRTILDVLGFTGLLFASLTHAARANDQCQDLEIRKFTDAIGYGPNRFVFYIFNHGNYGEPAPTGASIAVFFAAQGGNPVTRQNFWPPLPQQQQTYIVFVPGAANHKITASIWCRRY